MIKQVLLLVLIATLGALSFPTTGSPVVRLFSPDREMPPTIKQAVPVMVALVDQLPRLPKEYAAAVLRRSDGLDIILLPRGAASAELLDAAMRTLVHARSVQGTHPKVHNSKPFNVLTLGVRPVRASQEWTNRYLQRAQVVVDSLRVAPRVLVRGVGAVPAVEIYAPNPLP